MARRIYTEDEQAQVALILQVNRGALRTTARETGIPVGTLRDWKMKWEKEGYPDVSDLPDLPDFVVVATEVRDLMLVKLREKVEAGQATARELVTGIGVLEDKIRVAKGLATNRTETVAVQSIDAKELAKELAQFVDSSAAAIQQRADVIDAEWSEVKESKPRALALAQGD
jgi:hypothetical protein